VWNPTKTAFGFIADDTLMLDASWASSTSVSAANRPPFPALGTFGLQRSKEATCCASCAEGRPCNSGCNRNRHLAGQAVHLHRRSGTGTDRGVQWLEDGLGVGFGCSGLAHSAMTRHGPWSNDDESQSSGSRPGPSAGGQGGPHDPNRPPAPCDPTKVHCPIGSRKVPAAPFDYPTIWDLGIQPEQGNAECPKRECPTNERFKAKMRECGSCEPVIDMEYKGPRRRSSKDKRVEWIIQENDVLNYTFQPPVPGICCDLPKHGLKCAQYRGCCFKLWYVIHNWTHRTLTMRDCHGRNWSIKPRMAAVVRESYQVDCNSNSVCKVELKVSEKETLSERLEFGCLDCTSTPKTPKE